jgi:hypothetical protein
MGIELQDFLDLLVTSRDRSTIDLLLKERAMNEVSQALTFLAQSLVAKDRVIEQLQGQIADLQKQLQAAMATQPPKETPVQ